MNVLIMTDKLITGGAEIYFCKLENELSHPKFTFYSAAATGELLEKIKYKNKFIEIGRKSHLRNLLIIREKILNNHIHIVHANSLRMVLYSIAIRKFTKQDFKIIYTKHNITALEKLSPSLFCKILNSEVDSVITVSHYEQNHLINLGVNRNKIKTIYNGVDLHQFTFTHKEKEKVKSIGILARLSKEKNHDLFIEIAKELKHDPHLMFYIAGDGPQFQYIKEQISLLNIQHKVKLLGAVHTPETFIKEMDVLLLTSDREVFPMVILEAMAVGTPVITIDRGGIKEAIQDDETGFLISDHSVHDFCEKIKYVVKDEKVRDSIIEHARKKVEVDFSLDQMVKHTLNEYLKYC